MSGIVFVVNPNAASGRAARVWASLRARVAGLDDASTVLCSGKSEATGALLAALKPDTRRVIALGGDGTLHHTLNTLLTQTRCQGYSVGLIPVGTGSDLARGLGLETTPERALQRALELPPRSMDLLHLEAGDGSRYLVNVASLGLSAPVVERINRLPRRNTLTYLVTALRVLFAHEPQWARIALDGKTWKEGRFHLVVVANGSCFAKGMRIAPGADPRDGRADVVLIEAVPKATILRWLPTVYLGRHLGAPFVHWAQAREIAVETGDRHPLFEGDGEVTLPAPGRISVKPGAVQFCGAAPE